ncbi:MAG TPA: hypothetical protein VFJ53_01605 [Solirubrobacterales bacterium]|nr:hypothetical protein [Solirubrobacterales bacterium]
MGGMLWAGCGSGDSTNASATGSATESSVPEAPTGPLTKAEFVKQGNAICKKGVEEKEEAVLAMAKIAAESNRPPSNKVIEKLVTAGIVPIYTGLLDELSQMTPPKGDEQAVAEVIRRYEADLAATEADPIRATKEDSFADANPSADQYGLKSCQL